MKKGPFKLRSGNNPDMQELSGVSPMKQDKGFYKEKFESKKIDSPKTKRKKGKFTLDHHDRGFDMNTEDIKRIFKDNFKNFKDRGFDSKNIPLITNTPYLPDRGFPTPKKKNGNSPFRNDKEILRRSNRKLIQEQRELYKRGKITKEQFKAAKEEIKNYTDIDAAKEHLKKSKNKK